MLLLAMWSGGETIFLVTQVWEPLIATPDTLLVGVICLFLGLTGVLVEGSSLGLRLLMLKSMELILEDSGDEFAGQVVDEFVEIGSVIEARVIVGKTRGNH